MRWSIDSDAFVEPCTKLHMERIYLTLQLYHNNEGLIREQNNSTNVSYMGFFQVRLNETALRNFPQYFAVWEISQ